MYGALIRLTSVINNTLLPLLGTALSYLIIIPPIWVIQDLLTLALQLVLVGIYFATVSHLKIVFKGQTVVLARVSKCIFTAFLLELELTLKFVSYSDTSLLQFLFSTYFSTLVFSITIRATGVNGMTNHQTVPLAIAGVE